MFVSWHISSIPFPYLYVYTFITRRVDIWDDVMELLYPFFCFLLNNNALFYFVFFQKIYPFFICSFSFLVCPVGRRKKRKKQVKFVAAWVMERKRRDSDKKAAALRIYIYIWDDKRIYRCRYKKSRAQKEGKKKERKKGQIDFSKVSSIIY